VGGGGVDQKEKTRIWSLGKGFDNDPDRKDTGKIEKAFSRHSMKKKGPAVRKRSD